jgi:hypothetical protein
VTQKVEQVRTVSSNLGNQDKGTCSSMSKGQHVDKGLDSDQGKGSQVMGLLVSESGAQGPDQNVEGTQDKKGKDKVSLDPGVGGAGC